MRDDAMDRWAANLLVDPEAYWACVLRGVEREDPENQLDALARALDAFARQFPDRVPPCLT